MEHKDVFGITFEQGRNEAKFGPETFSNIVTQNKTLTEAQKRDLILCLITLKYTQSNSVCYAEGGQIIMLRLRSSISFLRSGLLSRHFRDRFPVSLQS